MSSTAAVSQHAGQQVDGLDFVQAAVFLAFAARRADGVENECFAHGLSPGERDDGTGSV
jgi:hypothetical protein